MSQRSFIFSSESVTEGHPDKVSDQVSDTILDACLEQDPESRVACETLVTTGLALLAGEITTKAQFDMVEKVRGTLANIGYTDAALGFDAKTCAVNIALDKQSPDISQGVSIGEGLFEEQGAGDQGIMFGYACNETDVLMPLPIHLSHRLAERLALVRKDGTLDYLGPDGKTQVSVVYENNKPVSIDTVVVSSQHREHVSHKELEEGIIEEVIKKIIPQDLLTDKTRYLINPTGRFVVGGPMGDCGLTGRKIIVDTYGGMGRHGGGAFSGKDPSKVDRSATYMARYAAKNVVAAGLADRCEVQLAYAIGYPEPVSLLVETFGTAKADEEKIESALRETMSFKPADIVTQLDLKKPRYLPTAAYGHFGRTGESFTWEKTDKVEALKKLV